MQWNSNGCLHPLQWDSTHSGHTYIWAHKALFVILLRCLDPRKNKTLKHERGKVVKSLLYWLSNKEDQLHISGQGEMALYTVYPKSYNNCPNDILLHLCHSCGKKQPMHLGITPFLNLLHANLGHFARPTLGIFWACVVHLSWVFLTST